MKCIAKLLLLLSILMPCSITRSAGLTDSIDIAQPNSERAHAYRSGGKVARETAGDFVGGHDMRRPARVVRSANSWVSYQLRVPPNVPVSLEFEEMENRDRDVRGYSVWVDGQRVYFRTAQSSGSGPLHFWVQVPPRTKNTLVLKLQNETDAPFRIARIWAFADFAKYFDGAGMAVPYHLAPTMWLGEDFEADRKKLQAIKDSLGAHPNAYPAWTTWVSYANMSDRDIATRLDTILRLSETLDMPVQICFDTWWANTPGGSDGAGGLWTDVQYQQVVYNQTTRQFQLSIPNRWGNTPWLSVGHPRLNAFKAERLRVAMQMLQARHMGLRARGKGHLVLAINLDNEPVYWATGNAGLGNEILQADFNRVSVEAARRDKVLLDPTDGLDFSERRWLFKHLLNYNRLIGEAAAGALRSEAILVDEKGAHPNQDSLRNNIYTQAMVANPALQFPMQDARYPFWETAAPSGVRVGGEWNGNSLREREAVLHQLPLGRTAQINAEAGNNAEEMQGVRPGYALGQRFYALYNYPLDKMDVAASEIHDTTQPFAPFVYERVLREETFRDGNWQSRVAETAGLQRGVIGNTTAEALFPASNSQIGFLTYRLDAPQSTFDGLNIELSGRAFVFRATSSKVFIRILAGTQNDLATMREVGRFGDSGDINAVRRFDLSDVARGQKTVFARIELSGAELPPSVLSWSALYHLRFTMPWPQTLLQSTLKQDESLATQRRQNLLVSWRRDAELVIEELAQSVAADAETQAAMPTVPATQRLSQQLSNARQKYEQGDYAAAYRLSNAAMSSVLPATYAVRANGQLAPYPIWIETSQPVVCTIRKHSRELTELHLRAPVGTNIETSVTVRVTGLAPEKRYVTWQSPAQNESEWRLLRAPAQSRRGGESPTARGEIVRTVTVPKYFEEPKPRALKGIFRSVAGKTPPALLMFRADGRGTERVELDEPAALLRGEPGREATSSIEQLQRGDALSVVLNESGIATSVTAAIQTIEGVVQQVGQMQPHAMPFVTLSGTAIKHVIDLSAPLHLPQSDGAIKDATFKSAALGSVAVGVGDRIRIRIDPSTGRVWELWKLAAPSTP